MNYNTKPECWKDVLGYEGLYKISDHGNIYSNYRKRVLIPQLDQKGYMQIHLYKNKTPKTHAVHRLVAEAFIPNKFNKEQVNHKDENKTNNAAGNLEWATASENVNHGTRTQRTSKQVIQISKNAGKVVAVYNSIKEASQKTGLLRCQISRCCNKKAKSTGGFIWMHLEEYEKLKSAK